MQPTFYLPSVSDLTECLITLPFMIGPVATQFSRLKAKKD